MSTATKKRYNFKGIIDTTFRDGQQSPLLFDTHKYRFSLEDKKLLIKGLIELGITHFEFFSPIVSKTEADDFIKIKTYVSLITDKKINFLTHCRCHFDDIRLALEAGFDGLNLYMGLSSHAQEFHYGKNLHEFFSLYFLSLKVTPVNFYRNETLVRDSRVPYINSVHQIQLLVLI